MKKLIPLGALLSAGACTPVPVPGPVEVIPEAGGGGSCNAASASALVGRTATTELGGEAMRMTGATALRWIQPGDAVTMDYRTDRLNIELDAQNKVSAIRCG